MSGWAHKEYGSVADPVHKSHLNELTGEYGCPRRFKYQRDAELAATAPANDTTGAVTPITPITISAGPTQASGKSTLNCHLACGTAAHETIARALNNPRVRDHLLRIPGAELAELDTKDKLESRVRATFSHELRVAADGRAIDWGDEDPEKTISQRIDMIVGTLATLCKYVRRVVAVEPGFIVQLEGIWYSGHIDLVFEPVDGAPGDIGIADWKSGKSKPDEIELEHGWEGGIYSAACQSGVFLPRECVAFERDDDGMHRGRVTFVDREHGEDFTEVVRPTRWQAERDGLELALKHLVSHDDVAHAQAFQLNRYPSRVYHVHMRDFVPYEKAGTKDAKRPEDLVHYGLDRPTKIKYIAGHLRGPGFLPVALHPNDVARLAYRARNVIGTVRMGRFVDLVREHCRRCPFKSDCLTGGYSLRGDELVQLQKDLKKAGIPTT